MFVPRANGAGREGSARALPAVRATGTTAALNRLDGSGRTGSDDPSAPAVPLRVPACPAVPAGAATAGSVASPSPLPFFARPGATAGIFAKGSHASLPDDVAGGAVTEVRAANGSRGPPDERAS